MQAYCSVPSPWVASQWRRCSTLRRYRYARRHVQSGDGRETRRHRCENLAACCRCGDDFNWCRAAVAAPMEEPKVGAVFPYGHAWPRGDDGVLTVRSVASTAAPWTQRWSCRWWRSVYPYRSQSPSCTARPRRPGAPPFLTITTGCSLGAVALLVAPWTALAAIVRQKEAIARHQALAFALERSELERQALDARLHLLQAQVAPHFLFNTLANVQALVDAGSPQASAVLRSLIAYLRAAVPLLHEPAATIGRELQLVRAYLELMHMRMPDRLQYALHVDPSALDVALSADDAADARRERRAPRHRPERRRRPDRRRHRTARRPCVVRVTRHRRRTASIGERTRHRPRRRCASGCS